MQISLRVALGHLPCIPYLLLMLIIIVGQSKEGSID